MDDVLQNQIEDTQRAFATLAEALQPVVQEIVEIIQRIVEAIKPIIEEIAKQVKRMSDYVINQYPNKRVAFLALRHKSARVRKKNTNRILKWLRKEGVL